MSHSEWKIGVVMVQRVESGPHVEGTYVVSELQGTGRVGWLSYGWRV